MDIIWMESLRLPVCSGLEPLLGHLHAVAGIEQFYRVVLRIRVWKAGN